MAVEFRIKSVRGVGILATGFLGFSLVATNPRALGPLGVTTWFLLLLIALTANLGGLFYLVKTRLKPFEPKGRQLTASLRQGLLLSAGLTIILALNTLRQLSTRDVVLLGLILALIEVYFRLKG